ncbi:MAG: HAMP domain-containing protein [Planctomycetes bacterium]|nr:HAMP domain-containing protein [Planctomycetota bacterium]
MSMRSLHIRTRLTFIFLALQALLAVVFAVSLYGFFSMEHMAEEDRNLSDKVHALVASYDLVDGRVVLSVGRRRAGTLWADSVARITTPGGEVLYCNRPEDATRIPLPPDAAHATSEAPAFASVMVPDRGPYRIAWCVDRHHTQPVVISVASSLDRLKAEQRDLIRLMVPTAGGILVLSAVLSWFTVGRLLRPLQRMTRKARRITADNLAERLAVYNPHDEIGELATTLNDMIERLHTALAQARRFTSDASHEMRTPLASIRTELESVALRGDLPEEHAECIGSALEELDRLIQLLEGLLTLAQLDAGRFPLQSEWLDPKELALTAAERMKVQAEAAGKRMAVHCSDGACRLNGDRRLLEQVLLNLVDNAIRYGGHDIVVRCEPAQDQAVFSVQDSGPGIPAEHLPHLFDRFYRVDPSRSRKLGGAGLGLALTKQWVEMHGGTITVMSGAGEGTTLTVRLPTAKQPATASEEA